MSAKESNNIVRQFASVQKRAAVIMGGAFRTTAMAALNVELYLPPMKVQMERMVRETAVRIRIGPAHGLDGILNSRREDERTVRGVDPLGGASQEEGWMPTSSPRIFGRSMGEPVCIYPGTMASAFRSGHP
ncbi:uncharacterized protein ASPGLDRAFT_36277 [Aspergillus glaucus CBS 516.65]|uniref:Uncharacterized protein n=1 Tax=Aspergillus glaucus CBS 516.65 TaxID=1160497 RepID=A0A1L9VHY3_ASPGL|nr:hypothetical protein ASPGLDRAFT_36277 [Aspergillus glaucus CBS 516.65]OJJ83536.1 hypothetical protein ASPGLDRAFT_36277 [Aspergillus glaucus CBS 516.65]